MELRRFITDLLRSIASSGIKSAPVYNNIALLYVFVIFQCNGETTETTSTTNLVARFDYGWTPKKWWMKWSTKIRKLETYIHLYLFPAEVGSDNRTLLALALTNRTHSFNIHNSFHRRSLVPNALDLLICKL